jgi:replication initiation protein RepC
MKHAHSGDLDGRQTTYSPTGLRRITPAMLPTEHIAAGFVGGDFTPGQALAAFKAAAPYLGIAPRVVHAIDWLFRFTQVQDWQPGARPIVWPSAAQQGEWLGLGLSQAQRLNRHLVELGLIVMRDSPNGKRYGRRDRRGRIIEAYGFDLSPIAVRIEEFRSAAEAGRAEREAVARLRRRATIARNSLRQTWETYVEQAIHHLPALKNLKDDARAASQALCGEDQVDRLTPLVEALEAVAVVTRKALEMALTSSVSAASAPDISVEMRPKGRVGAALITSTNQNYNPNKDKVMVLDKCSRDRQAGKTMQLEAAKPPERQDRGSVLKITPDDLIGLAPRLRPYLNRPSPSWPEIVNAADWLRHDLGVSKPLWGDACITMGREQAAVALALVSTKPPGHFRTSPGCYFHGMVERARAGNLHLDRTIWVIRSRSMAKSASHNGGQT